MRLSRLKNKLRIWFFKYEMIAEAIAIIKRHLPEARKALEAHEAELKQNPSMAEVLGALDVIAQCAHRLK